MAAKPRPNLAKARRRVFVAAAGPGFGEGLIRLINAETDLKCCGSAVEVKESLKDFRRLKPDVAVIDWGLPGKNALQLIQRTRSQKLPVKLLVATSLNRVFEVQQVLRAGGDGCIVKQAGAAEIIYAIRDVLNGHIYVSEEFLVEGRTGPQSASQVSLLARLTDAELEILALLGEGKSQEEMARQYQTTASEVNDQCLKLQHTLGLRSINALIRHAVCWVEGIIK